VGPEDAGQTGEEGADDKGFHLVGKRVLAEDRRRRLVVSDGLEDPSEGAQGQEANNEKGNRRRPQDQGEIGGQGVELPGEQLRPGDTGKPHGSFRPLLLVLEDHADDLREAQGGDSEVVPL